MRDKIRANEYIVPDHAYEDLQDDVALDRLLQQRKELARPQTLDVIEFA